ncbi:MAG: hypothetical protein JWN86_135 [Planctomycetota bacterium]|nr:hypothetical protein [Planctomycetota bacterium]
MGASGALGLPGLKGTAEGADVSGTILEVVGSPPDTTPPTSRVAALPIFEPATFTVTCSQPAAGALTIPAGKTSRANLLKIVNHRLLKGTTTVQISLSSPMNAVLGARTTHTHAIVR